jgi:hypothetical protein
MGFGADHEKARSGLIDLLRLAASDPGAYTPRRRDDANAESVPQWSARASVLAFEKWLDTCLTCGEVHEYRPSGRYAKSGSECWTWESPADGHGYRRRANCTPGHFKEAADAAR